METLLLVNAVIVGAFALLYGSLLVICAPRSTWAVFVRGLDSFGRFARDVVDYSAAFFAIGVRPERETDYERDCKKYADTLPAFSDETERIMQREGHWPFEPPRHVPKAPGLMHVWSEREPEAIIWGERPSPHLRQRYGQVASVKPNNETEAMCQMKALQIKARKLQRSGVHIDYGSHPMDKPSYAPRIAREVVEVEEVEVTSKASAEVTVQGFERHYYKPIEEPDISRILLDKS